MSTPAFPPGGTLLETLKLPFNKVTVAPDQSINTTEFLDASESLTTIFDTLGAVAFGTVKADILGNVKKLRTRQSEAPAESETVQGLVKAELATKKHTATEGLVWLVRALDFTCKGLQHNVENSSTELVKSFNDAYEKSLKPHHNFMVKAAVGVALKACPYRKDFYAKLGDDEAKVTTELKQYLDSLSKIVSILQAFQETKEAKW